MPSLLEQTLLEVLTPNEAMVVAALIEARFTVKAKRAGYGRRLNRPSES